MKKKLVVIGVAALIVIVGGWFFTRFYILKQKETPVQNNKAATFIDLRPSLIAKLQQLVKDGSDGLYNLQIEQLNPDVLKSRIDFTGISITPDIPALKRLDSAHKAPDDVFEISLHSLHVDGLSVKQFVFQKNINLGTINIEAPSIKIYHTKRVYNAAKRKDDENKSLYQKIMKQFKSIVISKILIKKGTITINDLITKSNTIYKNVSVNLNDIEIDSTTQYAKNRFLFAKEAAINIHDYIYKTSDSLYMLKCASIDIQATDQTLTAKNVEFIPRVSRQAFQKKLTTRQSIYTFKVPTVTISSLDWWKLTNKESIITKKVNFYNPDLKIFLNKGLPSQPLTNRKNFPQQLIMEIRKPVSISTIVLHNMNLSYQEFYPKINRSGTIYFNNINATATNITNIKAGIKNSVTKFTGKCLFMKKVPVKATAIFGLNNVAKGNYTADIYIGAADTSIINPIAQPMGLFKVKSGSVKEATIHIASNIYKAKANMTMLYNNLNITLLKEKNNKDGQLKKKPLLGTIANVLLIKNSNPNKSGEVRTIEYSVDRGKSATFTNMTWKIIIIGILKTLGIPEKLVKKD